MKVWALGAALLAACAVEMPDLDPPEHDLDGTPFPGGGKSDNPNRSPLWSIYSWNYSLGATDRHDKYCKMSVTPFGFYRGTNHLFWEDMAGDARLTEFGGVNTRAWLQGDLHAFNYGSFAGHGAQALYSLNDFDESLIADYQYDLWRMATSMLLLARDNDNLSTQDQEDFVDSFTEAYLDTMTQYRGNGGERSRVFDEQATYDPLSDFLDQVEDDNNRREELDKWSHLDYGDRRFDMSVEKLGSVSSAQRTQIELAMLDYPATTEAFLNEDPSYFQVKDVARRLLAGTGSLGTARYYVLVEGPTDNSDDDRILDLKEQSRPTPFWFLDHQSRVAHAANFPNPAERHATAMRALVHEADPLLGWTSLAGDDFSVRERSILKESFPADELDRDDDYRSMAEQWGVILATSHARADRDFDSALLGASLDTEIDELTNGRHSAFRAQVRGIAMEYAAQVEDDYALFLNVLAPTNCP